MTTDYIPRVSGVPLPRPYSVAYCQLTSIIQSVSRMGWSNINGDTDQDNLYNIPTGTILTIDNETIEMEPVQLFLPVLKHFTLGDWCILYSIQPSSP